MKKLLSVVLTLALLTSCIFMLPINVTNAAVVNNDWAINDYYTTIFDSNDYPAPDHKNPATEDSGTWLGGNSWVSGNVALKDSIYMGWNHETAKILERNKVDDLVSDFEWQFQFIADADTKDYLNTSFVFHVNENSNIASYSERNNVMAVTYYGSNFRTDKNGVVQNAFVVEYGGNSKNADLGYMRPFGYDSSTTPWTVTENSYKKLDDASAEKAIDIAKYVTINIKMEGLNLKVAFWQTDDKENTYREFSVLMHKSAYEKAKYGDFAIISAHNDSSYGIDKCNYRIKDMQISRPHIVFNSGLNTITQNPGNSAQISDGTIQNAGGVYTLPRYASTDEIIESYYGKEVNLTDFVFESEFRIDNSEPNADYAGLTFNFHVDKDREDTASKLPGDEGVKTGTQNRRYMLAAGVFGQKIEEADTLGTSGVALQSSVYPPTGTAGYVMAGQRKELPMPSDETKTYIHATSSVPLTRALQKNVYYTIRVVLSGKNLYTYIWESGNKAATLRSVYYTLTDEQYASAVSGDFAIVNNNRIINIRNMKIYDTVDVLESAEDYSEYTDIIAPTTYTFDAVDDFGSIVKGSDQETNLSITEDGKLQFGDDDDKERVTAINFDGDNRKLKDFIITFDYSTANAEASDSNWALDRFVFRSEKQVANQYYLEISRQGRSATNTYDKVALVKNVAGTTEILAEASLSRSLNFDTNYKVKIEVIGNVIKVYFAVDEVFNIPTLVCTDDAYSEGLLYVYHNRGISYFDNINIYDITATELAADINAIEIESLTRDTTFTDALIERYDYMHSAQKAKLAAYKEILDSAVQKHIELDMIAYNVNGDEDVDARDIVALKKLVANDGEGWNTEKDPLFDGILNSGDLIELRNWFLNS